MLAEKGVRAHDKVEMERARGGEGARWRRGASVVVEKGRTGASGGLGRHRDAMGVGGEEWRKVEYKIGR